MTTPVVLTIAGSDPSGSSGLQADLPTLAALGAHAASVLTLWTAQNTVGISAFHPLAVDHVAEQLAALLDDLPPVSTKTGLLYTHENVTLVADHAQALGRLVVDPVMVNSAGAAIVTSEVVDAYRGLCARAEVITPNRWEAELLLGDGTVLDTPEAVAGAAAGLRALGPEVVVVTGGRGGGDKVVDVLIDRDETSLSSADRVGTTPIRGTGCTFSAAVAAGLGFGLTPRLAVEGARGFVQRQLAVGPLQLGTGRPGVPHQAPGP